jgi:hypothetical protein
MARPDVDNRDFVFDFFGSILPMMLGRHLKPATVGHLPVERLTCALASFGPNAYLSTPSSGERLNGVNSRVTNISGEQQRSGLSRRLR